MADTYTDIHCALLIRNAPDPDIKRTGCNEKELSNIDKINQAVISDQSLEQIASVYLSAIETNIAIKASRLYLYSAVDDKLSLVNQTFEKSLLSTIENKIGTKTKSIIPPLKKGDFFYELIQTRRVVITSDKKEIEEIIQAHVNQPSLKKFAKWGIKVLNLQTFGAIPLFVGETILGLVTFAANEVLSELEKETILRYTQQVSGGLIQKITEKALTVQTKLTANILEELPIDVVIFNRDHRFIYANKSAISDKSLRKWVIGKTGVDYFIKKGRSKEEADYMKERFEELRNGQSKVQWIANVIDRSGEKHQFLRNMNKIIIEDNEYVIGYGIDVSQLMNTQEKLAEAQRISRLGSWELEMKSGELTLSEQAQVLLGVTSHQGPWTLKSLYLCIHEAHRKRFANAISNISHTPIRNLEVKITDTSGAEVFMNFNAFCTKNEKGNVKKVIGTLMDVTELRRLEDKFSKNQQLLTSAEIIGKIGSWEVNFIDPHDWRKNTTYWSDESYRIFGYEPNSVKVSYPFFIEHVHPDDLHLFSSNFSDWSIPGMMYETDFRIITKDGSIKHLYGKFTIEYDEENKPIRMVGITQDISHRKKLEIELQNYNQKLADEIEIQTKALKDSNQELDAFNYSISHDLRIPIRAIEMFTGLLRSNCSAETENFQYIDRIDKCVVEVTEMIDSLLAFSKYGKIILEKEPLNIKELLDECLELYKHNTSKVKFIISETPEIYADKILMRQVFNNLISNAVKYSSTRENPIIEIQGIKSKNHTQYSIKDNGVGFNPALSEKLFKPFARLHSSDEFEGNGAGLAIVQKIISRHGGTIWVDALPDAGATFYFQLPNK